MFSSRLPAGLPSNAIAQAVAAQRSRGAELIDLTETNPTMVGLAYPPDALAGLADARALKYEPEPLGLPHARAAVARECARAGETVDPERVVLTTSTSEAYALLFKLLCGAGDDVLVPQPSYPLFESLAALESVRVMPYRLEYHGRWAIDRESVQAALTPRTRAILVVTPNNPTGSMLRRSDRDWLADLAAEREIAIISDEVFRDYVFTPGPDVSSFAGESRALTFVLGGLSKSAGLPQVKLGWMVASGPVDLVTSALSQLEIICDTYLSVSTPVQVAAAPLMEAGAQIRAGIRRRLRDNLDELARRLPSESPVSLLPPEGGWSAVLRVPATIGEEALVLHLIKDELVVIHPGYFFDFPAEAFLVVSLLPETSRFAEGMRRILSAIERGAGH